MSNLSPYCCVPLLLEIDAVSKRCRATVALTSVTALVTVGLTCGPQVRETQPSDLRKRQWAQRLELKGVSNFHKVSGRLYRGAQPTAEGMRGLRELGIKTVVNLRTFHSDRDEIGDTPLGYEHVHMQAWDGDVEDIVWFLRIAADERRTPVFVHCQYGADRTGVACAAYRVVVEGWPKEEAIDEMVNGGFGFKKIWGNLIDLIRDLDAESIREQLDAGEKR